MRVYDEIAKAKDAAMDYALGLAQQIIVFTKTSANSTDGQKDGAEGWPADGDGDQAQLPTRRMEPWGVHGRPPAGILQVLARAMAGASQNLGLGIWTGSHGRQNLATGATQLYCIAENAEVYLDENGAVYFKASSNKNIAIDVTGSGDVVVNGGTAKVNRVGDAVNRTGVFALWVAAVRTQIVAAGGGDPGDCPVQLATTAGGADHFKA